MDLVSWRGEVKALTSIMLGSLVYSLRDAICGWNFPVSEGWGNPQYVL